MKKSTTPNIQFKLSEAENELLIQKAEGRPDGLASNWYKAMFLAGLSAFKPIKKAPVKAEVKVAKKVASPVVKPEVKPTAMKKVAKAAAAPAKKSEVKITAVSDTSVKTENLVPTKKVIAKKPVSK